MIDDEELVREEDEAKKKKKCGEGEAGAPPASGQATVGQGFFDYMATVGASKALITEILRSWRHIKGEGLLRRVADFVRGLIKSSHVEVEIDKGKDYGVVHNFIQSGKSAQTRRLDLKNQQTKPEAKNPIGPK